MTPPKPTKKPVKKTVGITENNHPIGSGIVEKKNCACGGKGCDNVAAESGSCGPFSSRSFFPVFAAVIIAIGLGLCGWFIGCGVKSFADNQRSIDTRGFSERDIKADLTIWNIGYVATGDDLTTVQEKIEGDADKIRAFLLQNGLTDKEIIETPTSMVDLLSRDYRPDGATKGRYIVTAGLRVRSAQVELVQSLSGMKIGALIKSGVTLRDNQQPPVYLFTKLKDIKPEMVAEATADAKRAAAQFAKDSGAHLGGMKSASQGVFQFLPRDQAMGVEESNEINKTARVVTTVSYFLAD